MARLVKTSKLLNLENAIGVLLAILIIFDLSLEAPLSVALNTTIGMASSFIILIILFAKLNPIIGVLFIIYLYQNYQGKPVEQKKKDEILKRLNPPKEMQVEELIILERAPIVNQQY
jgi:hypothetical protein